MSEPRIHHLVPQTYLRGFARPKGKSWQVRVVDLRTGGTHVRNVNRVFARRDWNTVTDDDGNVDHGVVERAFSAGIEEPAAPALAAMRRDAFPLREPYREYMALFMSAQLVRGRWARENLNDFIVETNRMVMKMKAKNYSDERWLAEAGLVPSDELKEQLFHSERYFHLEAATGFLLQTQMSSVVEIAELLHQRTWTLVRFEKPCLLTGEVPFVHINPTGDTAGFGVLAAEQMYLPISPTSGLLLSHPWTTWPEAVVDGTPELAERLNWAIVAYPSNDEVVCHPDVAGHPLPGVARLAAGGPWPWPPDPVAQEGPVWLQIYTERNNDRAPRRAA